MEALFEIAKVKVMAVTDKSNALSSARFRLSTECKMRSALFAFARTLMLGTQFLGYFHIIRLTKVDFQRTCESHSVKSPFFASACAAIRVSGQ